MSTDITQPGPARTSDTATTAPLTGHVVEHQDGGPVDDQTSATTTTSLGKRWVDRFSRFCHGVATAAGAFRDWRLATEFDNAIHLAEETKQLQIAGALRDRQEKAAADRRQRASKFITEALCIVVPIIWGGWFWATFTGLLATLTTLALLRSKAMHGRVPMRAAEMTGISFVLWVILGAALEVRPSPLVMEPFDIRIAITMPIVIWLVFTLGPAFADDKKVKAAEIIAFSMLGVPLGIVADLLYLGAHVQGLSWAWSPWYLLPGLVVFPPFAAYGLIWMWKATADDGTILDNLGAGDPMVITRSEVPLQADANESNAVRAIAKAIGVDAKDASAKVIVIGTPSTVGPWTVTHFQLMEHAFAELEKKTTPSPAQKMAQVLRRPTAWVYPDRIGDESQGLLYVASSNPWPEDPTAWPGLQSLVHDVFLPTELGTELFRGTPVIVPVAQSSELVAGGSGAGKTAWLRITSCVAVADPEGCEHDIADFKGDGALDMFSPLCSFHTSGQDDATVKEFAEWLRWARHEEAPRRKAVMKELVASRRAPDARLTRELARDPSIPIKRRVTTVDEAQIAAKHRKWGEQITEDLIFFAQQGRSFDWRWKIGVQKATSTSISPDITSILPTRVCGRAEDFQTSYAALGTNLLRADTLPEVNGVFILIGTGDGDAWRGKVRLIAHYVNAADASTYCDRLVAARGIAPTPPPPEVPEILLEMRRLLSEPSREGRMLSVEMGAALLRYELITVTPEELQGGKTEDQVRQEKVAALVSEHGVRTAPDRDQGNRMAYWLEKTDRGAEVGVLPAIRRIQSGRRGVSAGVYGGSPDGSPDGSPGRPRLHSV